jgi:hypothetical protein
MKKNIINKISTRNLWSSMYLQSSFVYSDHKNQSDVVDFVLFFFAAKMWRKLPEWHHILKNIDKLSYNQYAHTRDVWHFWTDETNNIFHQHVINRQFPTFFFKYRYQNPKYLFTIKNVVVCAIIQLWLWITSPTTPRSPI